MAQTRTRQIWKDMIRRCCDKKFRLYYRWDGRGITVCPEWMVYENFLRDMKERPDGRTLERKNNDLGYSKDNCKWATYTEQNRNRRDNFVITFRGETKTLQEWAEMSPVTKQAFRMRMLKEVPMEIALTLPGARVLYKRYPQEKYLGESYRDYVDRLSRQVALA